MSVVLPIWGLHDGRRNNTGKQLRSTCLKHNVWRKLTIRSLRIAQGLIGSFLLCGTKLEDNQAPITPFEYQPGTVEKKRFSEFEYCDKCEGGRVRHRMGSALRT